MKKAFRPTALPALLLAAVLLVLAPAVSGTSAGEALTGAVSPDASVLLFEPCGNTELFAYTDDTTYIAAADGSRSAVAEYPGQHAFLRAGVVTVVSDLGDFLAVQRFDADTLEETTSLPGFFPLEIAGEVLSFLEADGFGRLYAVLFGEPNEILVYDEAGGYTGSLLFAEPVRGMQVLDETLFVFFDGHVERIALHADFPQAGADVFPAAADVPHKMLDAETYIDSEGNLSTTDGTILLCTGANPTAVLTAYAGGSFFWASDPQTVSRFDTAGGAVALHPADGTLEALTGSAMLIRREGAFYRVPYGKFTQPATPTPTASPTPLPTPDQERVEVAFSGPYLIVPAGPTAARLRDALAPADVEVYTKNMSAAAGKLKTDQIAMVDGDLYTVIVPGDLNASGTVNTADLRLFQRVLAGDAVLDDAAAFAADLNGDGTADAADLVLLSARIAA